ncbi:hypothetical protein BDV25DRAFT_49718 [Aspergillus avenaceus]|uniref:DUF8035 domain-containing protein n=1 Tax=Aspergillus avenaceus TaxID=36643 RepID=A0A5N6TJE2_ASPAV|nr:hypothetical protein BDV25DRAFT_49718 [Aspergillus avenaceus]
MPRRHRARDYDDDVYEVERDHYHHKQQQRRPKGGRHYKEEEVRYEQPRAPSPPIVEEFDRLHIQDESGPELIRGLPRESSKELRKAKHDSTKRRRPPPREVVEEIDYVSEDDEFDRKVIESDSEDLPTVPRKRSVPQRGDVRHEVPKQRGRRSEYDREPLPRVDEYRRARSGPHYHAATRSGTNTEYEDEMKEEDEVVVEKSRRRKLPGSFDFEEDEGSSSPESEDSADDNMIRMPMPPNLAKRPAHVQDGYHIPRPPRPPRAPSPEVSFDKPKKVKGGRSSQDEILVEERSGPEYPTLSRGPPPEPFFRRKQEEYTVPRSRPRSIEREKDLSIHGIMPNGGDVFHEHDLVREVYDRPRDIGRPREPVHKLTGDDWAIVTAAPKAERDTTLLESPPVVKEPDLKDKRPKFTVSEERHSDGDPEFARGKVARRYIGMKSQRDGLWTEITKDLVVKEAIERSGYEYEETITSYYVFSYLQFEEVSALVDMSEDIRRARRRRIQEIHRERASMPPPPPAPEEMPVKPPLMLDSPIPPPFGIREERRMKERDLVEDRRGRPRSGRW